MAHHNSKFEERYFFAIVKEEVTNIHLVELIQKRPAAMQEVLLVKLRMLQLYVVLTREVFLQSLEDTTKKAMIKYKT